MPAAGQYNSRLRHLVCSRERDTVTGQDVETHTPGGYLWCSVTETGGRRQTDTGVTATGAIADIRIRQFPTVSALDKLLDESSDCIWHIESISNGNNELVIDAFRHDVFNTVNEA